MLKVRQKYFKFLSYRILLLRINRVIGLHCLQPTQLVISRRLKSWQTHTLANVTITRDIDTCKHQQEKKIMRQVTSLGSKRRHYYIIRGSRILQKIGERLTLEMKKWKD